jgi:hypothetical protein
MTDYQKGYQDGYKDAKEERPQGVWARHDEWVGGEYVGGFYHVCCPCNDGYFVKWRMKYCGNCGAPMQINGKENVGAYMHKPNCVTCDHFGKCDGCEKGEEE